jgi:hypothetical protein
LREEGLRAAMQAAARQGRLDRPNRPGEAGPVRVSGASPTQSRGTSPTGATGPEQIGTPINNNDPSRPDLSVIGRAREIKPVRSAKSKIVPEPDQI